jgi:hypothetical protein
LISVLFETETLELPADFDADAVLPFDFPLPLKYLTDDGQFPRSVRVVSTRRDGTLPESSLENRVGEDLAQFIGTNHGFPGLCIR